MTKMGALLRVLATRKNHGVMALWTPVMMGKISLLGGVRIDS
jgi:hypothetical protein